jgi:hypothetical protein
VELGASPFTEWLADSFDNIPPETNSPEMKRRAPAGTRLRILYSICVPEIAQNTLLANG